MAEEFNVQLRLPGRVKQGDIVEVKVKIKHPSRTGLGFGEDLADPFLRFVRAEPAVYVRLVEVFYGEDRVSFFEMNSATSDDPLLVFKLKADREAPVRVVVTDHLKEVVEATGDIKFA